jgi:hypothetical protein
VTEMNSRLARRPLDPKRKLPVPYSQLVDEDGVANFAALDGNKALHGAGERLCGLCGVAMGRWVAFLGGPRNVEHGYYVDPPMHVSCAEDATRLCPHMARQRVPRRPNEDPEVITPQGFVEEKPERFAMWVTDGYEIGINQAEATYAFKPRPAREIRWFDYTDEVLTESSREVRSD